MIHASPVRHQTLEARLKVSEEKVEQLKAENESLNAEIARLNDEIEVNNFFLNAYITLFRTRRK